MKRSFYSAFIAFVLVVFGSAASHAQPIVCSGSGPGYVPSNYNINVPCDTPCTNLTSTLPYSYQTTSYSVSQIPYTPYAYNTGINVPINQDDRWSPVINLPFNFCFFGTNYTQITIGSNGAVSFNIANANTYNTWPIANPIPNALPADMRNSIMFPWHDIYPLGNNDIYYNVYGTAPCRVFVVSFTNAPLFSCTGLLATQQVLLYETSHVIEINIQNKPLCAGWNQGRAIEGIQNNAGTVAFVVPGRNSPTQWTATNDARRFQPTGTQTSVLSWYQGGSFIGTGTSINVCPQGGTTVYTAQMVHTECNASTPNVVQTFTVTVPTTLSVNIDSSDNVSCFGYNNGVAYGSFTGGTAPHTILWTPVGGNGNTASNLPPGAYTYSVTDSGGCVRVDTVNITQPAPFSVNITGASTIASCNANLTDTLTAVPAGGTGGNTFEWSNFEITPTITVYQGCYDVTVTDNSGCEAYDTACFVINQGLISFNNPTTTNVLCFGDSTGTASVNPVTNSFSGSLSYVWSDGQITNPAVNLAAGTYTVVVTTQLGCPGYDTVTITQPAAALTVNPPTVTQVTCAGGSNGAITANVAGGVTPYTYDWSASIGGATYTGQTITGLNANTYNMLVTDSNGCTATDVVSLINPQSVQIGAPQITPISCFGASDGGIVVTASGGAGGYTYSWVQLSNSATYSNDTLQNLSADTYDLTVTDASGCISTASIVLSQPSQLQLQAPTVTNVNCFGDSSGIIQITATGGTLQYSFNWAEAGGATYVGTPLATIPAGNYSVTVTDAQGCTDSTPAPIAVTEPAAPLTIASAVVTDADCNGASTGSIALTITGGTGTPTTAWTQQSNGQGYLGNPLNNIPADGYTANVTDQLGCTTDSFFTVNQPPALVLNPIITQVDCNGAANGTIDANGSGGTPALVYTWSNGLPSQQTQTGLAANTYGVTVTDQNGCADDLFITITQPTAVQIQAPIITHVSCFGAADGMIDAIASGGTGTLTYTWVSSNGGQNYTDTLITGLGPDTYNLTVTDQNGCSDVDSFVITEPSAALTIASQSQVDILCNGDSTGSASAVVTGGTPAYSYSWNGGGPNAPTKNNLPAGPINLLVTDANGCTTSTNFTLTEPLPLVFNPAAQVSDVSCYGGHDGRIQVFPSGGYPGANGYSFLWSNGSVTDSATALGAGTYQVIVSDSNGCQLTQSFTILDAPQMILTIQPIDAVCFGTASGSLDLTVVGGTPTYTYAWSDGNTTEDLTAAAADNYNVTVTDAHGCTQIANGLVGEPSQLLLDLDAIAVSCIDFEDGQVLASALGGTSPYGYAITQDFTNWQNSDTGHFVGLAVGTWTVLLSDENGCTITQDIDVPNAEPDFFDIITDSTSCYGPTYEDGAIHINGLTPLNTPYTFSLDGGLAQYSGDFYYVTAGQHTITAINGHGCITEIPVIVFEPLPIIVDVMPDTVIIPLGGSEQVLTTYINAPGMVTYNWTPADGLSCTDCPNPTVAPFNSTTYTVTVMMPSGSAVCYGYATLYVDVDGPEPVFVPNVFSPNGDGNNDQFMIYGNNIREVKLRVFNRWGEKVFDSDSQLFGWDGTYKGVMQMPSVFTWEADIIYLNNKAIQKYGTITLVR